MRSNVPDMLDVAFELQGSLVPLGYAFELWDEILHFLPWLEAEETAGVIPLRGMESDDGILLAKRSRLVLRLPENLAAEAMALSGTELRLDTASLKIGHGVKRPLQAFSTLHAHLVASAGSEEEFLAEMALQLDELGIPCNCICGRHSSLSNGERTLSGFSLVLHNLKPEDSLRVQKAGLGAWRRFGCGIFLPFKTISGLE